MKEYPDEYLAEDLEQDLQYLVDEGFIEAEEDGDGVIRYYPVEGYDERR